MPRKAKMRQVTEPVAVGQSAVAEPVSAVTDAAVAHDVLGQDQQPAGAEARDQTLTVHEQGYAGLLPMLQRLDARLAAAVEAAERVFAARAAGDLYRGLAISPADVAAAFGRVPGTPFLALSMQAHEIADATHSLSLRRLLWLKRVYGLTAFDLDVLLIGLAPEIDLRYERLYAYLQDDVTKRRPGIDLSLNILCASAGEKLQQRERFAPDAPLVRHRLIEILTDPHHQNPPLLARFFRLDEQIVRFLLLDDGMDSRLAHFCRMATSSGHETNAPLTEALQQQLQAIARNSAQTALRVYFEGPVQCGQKEALALLASFLNMQVLQADMQQMSTSSSTREDVATILVREAWFRGAILYCNEISDREEDRPAEKFWHALKELPTHCVLQGKATWSPAAFKPQGVVTVRFSHPEAAQRKLWWQRCLDQSDVTLSDESLTTLAQRYRLTYAQIQDAAKVSIAEIPANSADGKADCSLLPNIMAAARAQSGHDLAALATKINPKASWEDLILPADAVAQLHEVCNRAIHQNRVFNDWGFAKKLARGRGTAVLFSGGSGTGKTIAAEIVANALNLDLYRIDLARVVDKYVGVTEKNLDSLFNAAENCILFFDEADALFGKRTEVKDGHDHYANLQVSYLLQKIEEYDGVAILATNLADNMDQAFTRRLAFHIYFPFPDEAARLQMWTRAWPKDVPMSASVDRGVLAREMKLAGGNIKNIALAAAFNAASTGGVVDMAHMAESARREYQKIGRLSSLTRSVTTMSQHKPKAE